MAEWANCLACGVGRPRHCRSYPGDKDNLSLRLGTGDNISMVADRICDAGSLCLEHVL